jgi:hypothetical protein
VLAHAQKTNCADLSTTAVAVPPWRSRELTTAHMASKDFGTGRGEPPSRGVKPHRVSLLGSVLSCGSSSQNWLAPGARSRHATQRIACTTGADAVRTALPGYSSCAGPSCLSCGQNLIPSLTVEWNYTSPEGLAFHANCNARWRRQTCYHCLLSTFTQGGSDWRPKMQWCFAS